MVASLLSDTALLVLTHPLRRFMVQEVGGVKRPEGILDKKGVKRLGW